MNFMKSSFVKTLIFSALFCGQALSNSLIAQTISAQNIQSNTSEKYLVKANLLGLPLNNYSLQFERAIGKKTALGLGVRFMPKSGIPLATTVESMVNDADAWEQIKDFRTGNIAFTPEVRFYLGKGVFHGFYIAPFARYSNYSAELPFSFEVPDAFGNTSTEVIPMTGNFSTITGGVLAGAQWALNKQFYLDWSILGPQYGVSNGSLKGLRSLNSDEQAAVRDELNNLEDLPFITTTYTVDNSGITADLKGPWAGIRSSLSIGVRF